ncbi:hypothetical protein AAFC00_007150 [Neodothiora populina]|uniref:DUF1990 domain-containing protein n=1 Tax=Neodothiora populina TaxID=2781224 RepID=A0ABR3PHJ9_9PEZI
MGVIRTFLALTGYSTVGAAGTWAFLTRGSKFVPVSANDSLLGSTWFARFNPDNNPPLFDVCVKKVPLSKIKPEYLENEGKLAEKFCAGVWGGWGYAYQRHYLEKKYRSNPKTAHQVWDTKDLQESNYPVGMEITDHFEVIAHTPESIIVRCGASPLDKSVRPSDGLFEMRAEVNKDEGVAEFQLKSCFYQGLGKAEGKPMPPFIEFLHRQYTKLWMETAVRNVLK